MKQQQEVIVGRHLQKCERGTVRLQCEPTMDGNLREHTECFKTQVHTTMRDDDSKDTQ
jgi:hypothetical protein